MDNNRLSKRRKIVKIAFITVLLAVMVLAALKITPFIERLADDAFRTSYIAELRSKGFLGWLIVVGLQALQIVVALIPGEPIEMFSGMVYGVWGGLLTCYAGVFIGTVSVIALVKLLGYPFVASIFEEKDLKKLSFLKKERRLEEITFAVFLIPGTPKDIFTYIAGLTPIRPVRFVLIATFARFPSIITSTYAGSALGKGKWLVFWFGICLNGTIGTGRSASVSQLYEKERENKYF